MSIQVWSIGIQKLTKMTKNRVHIRSTDHFKQVGAWRNDRNEINNMDDHCVWLHSRNLFIDRSSLGIA